MLVSVLADMCCKGYSVCMGRGRRRTETCSMLADGVRNVERTRVGNFASPADFCSLGDCSVVVVVVIVVVAFDCGGAVVWALVVGLVMLRLVALSHCVPVLLDMDPVVMGQAWGQRFYKIIAI